MRFDFLGQYVFGADRPTVSARGHQPALTVARLVLERPRSAPREDLAELLWPEDRPGPLGGTGPPGRVPRPGAARRRGRGADVRDLARRAGGAAPRAATIEVDVELAFADTDSRRTRRSTRCDWARADELSSRALERLRLPFFPTSNAEWTRRWQDRVRGQLLRALHIGADAALGAGASPRAVTLAEEALAVDPFDEVATRTIMAAYEALGRRGEALTRVRAVPAPARRGARRAARRRDRDRVSRTVGQRAPNAQPGRDRGANAGARPSRCRSSGRQAELAHLDVDWSAVCEGDARAVVIAGEPGIGKTRLGAEIANAARERDAVVLWGACVAERRDAVPAVRRPPQAAGYRTARAPRRARTARRRPRDVRTRALRRRGRGTRARRSRAELDCSARCRSRSRRSAPNRSSSCSTISSSPTRTRWRCCATWSPVIAGAAVPPGDHGARRVGPGRRDARRLTPPAHDDHLRARRTDRREPGRGARARRREARPTTCTPSRPSSRREPPATRST